MVTIPDWTKVPPGPSNVTIQVVGAGTTVTVTAPVDNPTTAPNAGDFVEANGYISMEASDYSRTVGTSAISWLEIPDIGRTGSGMTPMPTTSAAQTPGGSSPHLEFNVYVYSTVTGQAPIWAYLSPRNNVLHSKGVGLRYAVSVDDEAPVAVDLGVALQADNVNMNRSWERNTSDNVALTFTTHTLTPGHHVVKFWIDRSNGDRAEAGGGHGRPPGELSRASGERHLQASPPESAPSKSRQRLTVAPAMTESYHSQHAPFGAFASFTIGLVGSPGGFGQSLRGPARQNVYAGFRRGSGDWRLLPFFKPVSSLISAYVGEADAHQAQALKPAMATLRPEEYVRRLTWASDVWEVDRFRFGLRTPIARIPDADKLSDEAARFHFAPVVCGFLRYDNTAGTEAVELMFGINNPDRQIHALDETPAKLTGFAVERAFGFATPASPAVRLRQTFSLFVDNPADYRGMHVLGPEAALVFSVPAGACAEFPIVLGFYQGGTVTTGIDAAYAYTRWFADLDDVLRHGLAQHGRYTQVALERDAELERSSLSEDQKFLLAQATHSYLGSSQLLLHDGALLWNVNEGEYRMINTFDLTVDHLFFELEWHPWAVRNALNLFSTRYSYVDEVRTPEGKVAPGGLSFTHDMGVMNHFTVPGRSGYECDNLTGCFSHMTMEQLLNWVITAVAYAWRTEDWAWLRRNHATLLRCIESMETRDHPDPEKRDGLLKCDSTRCGRGWEITTYDSLDQSLGQARNNLYLAVKALGAWILLSRALTKLGDVETAARAEAAICASTRRW